MEYKDDLPNGYVNGNYVGLLQGTATQDELDPDADGYEVPRNTVRIGKVTPDAAQSSYPVPQDYTVTYAKGNASATGTAPTETKKTEGATFAAKANTFTLAGQTFAGWLGSNGKTYAAGATVTMPGSALTLTALWGAS